MTSRDPIEDRIASCVSIIVKYYDQSRTRQSTLWMEGEVQTVATEITALGLKMREVDVQLFRSVESAQIVRFGPDLGVRLTAEFLNAFEGYGTFEHLAAGDSNPAGKGKQVLDLA